MQFQLGAGSGAGEADCAGARLTSAPGDGNSVAAWPPLEALCCAGMTSIVAIAADVTFWFAEAMGRRDCCAVEKKWRTDHC